MDTNKADISTASDGGSNNKKDQAKDWSLFFGGVLVALFGIVVLIWPGLTLVMLAAIAGVGLVVAGIFDFISWFRNRGLPSGSGWALVNAFCNLILGILFLVHPVIAAGVITFLVGCFVIAYGIMAIVSSFGLRNITGVWWVMLINGIISIFCGFMFVISPDFFIIFLGVFLIMRGVTMSTYGIVAPNSTNLV